MLRFAICDDQTEYLETVAFALNKTLSEIDLHATVAMFSNGKELLDEHRTDPFDVLILDIDMPQMSGFDIAKAVRELSNQPYVVFVTAKHELVYDSFEYQPFYFICKRMGQDLKADLRHVIDKLRPLLKQNKTLLITDNTLGQMAIPLKDILYIQSDKHYVFYFRVGDSIPLKERTTLAERENELKGFDFFKPHRRYLVNMKYVSRFDLVLHAVTMTNGENIPISRALKDEAFEAYRKFMRR